MNNIQSIRDKFAPVWKSPGILDARKTAQRCAAWSKFFLGDKSQPSHYHIRESIPQFHIDYYTDQFSSHKLSFICAPSEFGKTTCGTLIIPLYRILYFAEPYIVIASRTSEVAEEYLAEIKAELTDNQKLIQYYGELRVPKGGENKDFMRWAAGFIELSNGSRIRAVGWGGNVRGRKRGAFRITLFIGDDPEEIEDVESPRVLRKNRRWLNRSVLKRLDKDYGKARITGTLLSQQCLLAYLSGHRSWKGKVYTALVKDEKGVEHSIWEERWPTKFLQNERSAAYAAGELEDWYFERMNQAPENREERITGYKFHHGRYERKGNINFLDFPDIQDPIPVYIHLAIDPAFGMDQEKNDPRAIILFAKGKLPQTNEITGKVTYWNVLWVIEAIKNWMSPDLVIDMILDYHKKYYLTSFVVEAISGAQIYESLYNAAAAQDDFVAQNPLTPIFPKYQLKNKKRRIFNGLQPRCKAGQIYIRQEHEDLKAELDNFHIIDNPNLLDALEFGNRFTAECVLDPLKAHVKSQYEKYKPKNISMNKKDFRDWAPSSISGIGIN